MSDDATVKTCPGGEKCHSYSESLPEGWFEGTDYLGGPDYGVQYCAKHHAELLPGGEVVPMVPLERAVDAPPERRALELAANRIEQTGGPDHD